MVNARRGRRGRRPAAGVAGIALALLLGIGVAPRAEAVDNAGAAWLGVTFDGDFGREDWSPWMYMASAQYRAFDALDGTRQAVGQLGLGYRLDRGWRVSARLGYYHTDAPAVGTFHELRAQQLATWRGPAWGRVSLRFRAMLEQRWVDERSGTGWRFRPRLGLEWPSKRFERIDWMVFAESFFDLRELDWVGRGWNQQRFFVGARLPVRTRLMVEPGYQYQWVNPFGTGDLVNHTLVATFRYR
jgi:hypothetical protein